MNKLSKLTKSRAVSPVIATVILVAVTITVAVAVSYWMSGISSQYTSFEKVEIQSAECTLDSNGDYWEIVVDLKNSGTKAATLTTVYVNDKKAEYASGVPTVFDTITADVNSTITKQILSGAPGLVKVWIGTGGTLTAGTTINIKIHSAAGMDYIKLLPLN